MCFNQKPKLYNLQIYLKILFFTCYTYDKRGNEDYSIF